jgi:hypothetical protein
VRTERLTGEECEVARTLGYEVALCSKHGPWIENESGCPGCLHDALGIPWPVVGGSGEETNA